MSDNKCLFEELVSEFFEIVIDHLVLLFDLDGLEALLADDPNQSKDTHLCAFCEFLFVFAERVFHKVWSL